MCRRGWRHIQTILYLLESFKRPDITATEVGVCHGTASESWLRACPGLHLTMVDSWTTHAPTSEYAQSCDNNATRTAADAAAARQTALARTEFAANRRTVLDMDSIAAADRVPDASQDLVFIDADHSYGGVKRDLAAWWPKVKPGGIFCGHDYANPPFVGVQKAVDEWGAANGQNIVINIGWVWWTVKQG